MPRQPINVDTCIAARASPPQVLAVLRSWVASLRTAGQLSLLLQALLDVLATRAEPTTQAAGPPGTPAGGREGAASAHANPDPNQAQRSMLSGLPPAIGSVSHLLCTRQRTRCQATLGTGTRTRAGAATPAAPLGCGKWCSGGPCAAVHPQLAPVRCKHACHPAGPTCVHTVERPRRSHEHRGRRSPLGGSARTCKHVRACMHARTRTHTRARRQCTHTVHTHTHTHACAAPPVVPSKLQKACLMAALHMRDTSQLSAAANWCVQTARILCMHNRRRSRLCDASTGVLTVGGWACTHL